MALEDIIIIHQFIDKSTIWIVAFIRDMATLDLTDPTAVKVSLNKPDGTAELTDQAMTQYDGNTGIYEYWYHKGESSAAMAHGQWKGRVDAIDGSGADAVISPKEFSFWVNE